MPVAPNNNSQMWFADNLTILRLPHHVNQWKKNQPEQVHHVPEGATCFQRMMLMAAITTTPGFDQQNAQENHGRNDMKEVKPGEQKIEHVKGVRRQVQARLPLGGVLGQFDADKTGTTQQ